MAATTSSRAWLGAADPAGDPRVAHEVGIDRRGQPVLQWRLPRNCSLAPRQFVAVLGSLALLSAAIAAGFWLQGATLVLPFASLEVAALALALVAYARHATDGERLLLADDRLVVERMVGNHTDRIEFDAGWVCVEPRAAGALIGLSGQGRRIEVGRFVRGELRDALARELRQELLRRRAAV